MVLLREVRLVLDWPVSSENEEDYDYEEGYDYEEEEDCDDETGWRKRMECRSMKD